MNADRPYNSAQRPTTTPMPGNLHIFCLGAAAVIDTVLLLAVLERHNRRHVLAPVLVLVVSGWLWHAGSFAYALLAGATGAMAEALARALMLAMTAGLLLMPSAMLHGVWRIRRAGLAPLPKPDTRYLWAYLPMLALFPAAWLVWHAPAGAPFIDRVWLLAPAYGTWLTTVNLVAAAGFWRLCRGAERPHVRRFFAGMAATLVGLVALHAMAFLVAIPAWPRQRDAWLLAVTLSPVAPALVFAYYVLRYGFMRVMVERTLVYAAILAGGLLLHESLVRPVTEQLSGRFGLNFAIVEGVLVVGLILAYGPLRQRVAEGLRYLMGARVAPMRDQSRRLAVRMSEYAAGAPERLLDWFVPALREAMRVRSVTVVLFDSTGQVLVRAQSRNLGNDDGDNGRDGPSDADAMAARDALARHGLTTCGRRDAPDQDTLDRLEAAGAALAVRLRHGHVDGVLLVGLPAGANRNLGEEETNAAVLLGEQLAITLDVGLLHADRLAAERRALQNEKLGMLGLVASSIAHEVKNPLSSIKTIATVLAEDLGPDDPHAEDVRLIRQEADRMAATTARLLRFARPARHDSGRLVSIADVLGGTLHVMGYLARQRGVRLDSSISDNLPPMPADEDALREVFTNLLANAIDAAAGSEDGKDAGGTVRVNATEDRASIMVKIDDDGPGLPETVRRRLFEPFVTSGDAGTGLGLYIVARRVRELGGTIRCDTGDGRRGTLFTVEIPCNSQTSAS